jgi:hypothetical protein
VNYLQHYLAWCEAHSHAPDAQDSLASWLPTLVLQRHQRVSAADTVARQLFGERAPALLEALEAAGVLS